MKRLGLFLGGGGPVGIAWEHGVLAGLADSISFDSTKCTVIVGTSAGASVGADMALGKDPRNALALDATPRKKLPPPDFTKGAFAEAIALTFSPEASKVATMVRVGEIARKADTVLTETELIGKYEETVGTAIWPDVDLRLTATACSSGEPKYWSAADGIPLYKAVASSCAIPGYFPTISHDGEHYMDGVRPPQYHTHIAENLNLDAAIFIGPKIAFPPSVSEMLIEDMKALESTGVEVLTILGSERLDALGPNLMDLSLRPSAFESGHADGVEHSDLVKKLLA